MGKRTSIRRAELKQLLKNLGKVLLLDVRSEAEYNEKHIPFAENIPVELVESGKFVPESGIIIITACGKGGERSERAATHIREHYKVETYFLEDGSFGWFENETIS